MDPESLRLFLERDRESVSALKRQYWAERYRAEGPSATLEAAHQLHAQLCATRPDYPSRRERAADLAHHIELRRKLDHVAHALSLR